MAGDGTGFQLLPPGLQRLRLADDRKVPIIGRRRSAHQWHSHRYCGEDQRSAPDPIARVCDFGMTADRQTTYANATGWRVAHMNSHSFRLMQSTELIALAETCRR